MSVTPWSEGIFYLPTELVQYGVDVYEATALQPNQGNNPSLVPTSYWTIYSQGGANVVSSVSAGLGIAITGGGTSDPVVATNLVAGSGIALAPDVAPNSLSITNSGVLSVAGTAGQIGASTASGVVTLTNLGVLSVAGTAGQIGASTASGVVTLTNPGVLSVTASGGCASSGGQNPNITNTGVTSIIAGSNVTVSSATGAVTISAASGSTPTTQVLLAQQLISPGASGTFPVPTGGEGLYVIMGCSVPVSTGQSRQGQFSVWCYVNSAQRVQMGGSGLSDLGGVGGADIMLIIPVDGTSTFFYQNSGGQSLVNYSIVAFKMSGPVSGAF